MCLFSSFVFCLQGGNAFADKVGRLLDPELRRLASCLPARAVEAKASSTTERYSRAFQKFREWASCHHEITPLPSDDISVALYLEFCDNTFVEITIVKSKTDQYRDGSRVLLAKTGSISCPFDLLERYVCSAGLQLSSTLPFFRALYYQKSNCSYKLRSEGMSYTRTREIVLHAFAELGYPKSMFGLHSLRAGGASAAANAGISDRLFKRHGRWKSDSAKDGYVKDKLDSLLSVSRSLGC